MKVLIIGLPYFAKKVANSLTESDNKNQYLFFNTYEGKFDKLRFLCNLLSADVVYSIGGAIAGSKAINLALYLRKRVVMHWTGTDVLNAVSDFRCGKVNKRFIAEISHFCEAPWFLNELEVIGIKANILRIIGFKMATEEFSEFPSKFSVFSYVGKGREKFYGIDEIIQLANDFPDVEVKLAGISRYATPIPKNLKLLGWVDDMNAQYKDCVLFLRLPKHDGLSYSVREALVNGRYVGYSYKMAHTLYTPSYSKLKEIVLELKKQHEQGFLKVNAAGSIYVKENYSEDVVNLTLSKKLENIAGLV